MSDEEIILSEKDNLSITERFLILSDIFVSNHGNSKLSVFFYLSFFYIQIISGFFSPQLGILNTDNQVDKFLNNIEKFTRLKNFFRNDYNNYKVCGYILFFFFIFTGIYFYILTKITNRQSFYDFKKKIFIYIFKFFMYIAYNMILDMTIVNFCFKGDKNLIILGNSCNLKDNFFISIIYIFCFIYTIIMNIIVHIFHNDSFHLSNSYLSKANCSYDFIMAIHLIIYSFILNQIYFSKYIFLFYNLIASIFFYLYFCYVHLFFEKSVFLLTGIYHLLYVWASFIFLFFYIFPIDNLGLVFLSSSLLICFVSYRITKSLDYKLIYKTPFHKIKNKYYVLYFIKEIIRIINLIDDNEERKTLLMGLLEVHKSECTNDKCITKSNQKIYSPKTDEWITTDSNFSNNKLYLNSFIISLLDFWITQNKPYPDILITLSLYNLNVIGNICQSIFVLNKIQLLKMTYNEYFAYFRLKLKIRNYLIQNLKGKNKSVYDLNELNSSLYFQYEELSKKFVQEITNDTNYSLIFWNNLKKSENSINYNEFFKLTELIRKTKLKISKLFQELFNIYNRVNELFDLYLSYIEIVNNDYILKRNLEIVKKKNYISTVDMIKINYYNILFGKETGILIGNGDKGHEGQIVTSNKIITDFFGYSKDELKDKICTILMPKILAKIHNDFISNYVLIGKKHVFGKKIFKSFAKDKNNNIFMTNNIVNLFPVLNNSILFIIILTKEKNEDIILMDNYFNIQGMSSHLMSKLNIENKQLFTVYDIPFYSICPQFVGLYKNMIIIKNKKLISANSNVTKKGMFEIKKTMSGIIQKVINNKRRSNLEQYLFTPKSVHDDRNSYDFNIYQNSFSNLSVNKNTNNSSQMNSNNISSPKSHQRSFFFHQSFHNDKSIERTVILDDISQLQPPQQLLDINENIELECEIKIPNFILNFRNNTFQKDNNLIHLDCDLIEKNEENSDHSSFIEDEKLPINDEYYLKKNMIPKKKKTYNSINDIHKNKTKNDMYKSEEEIIFLNRINRFKVLFSKGEFNELKDYINQCNFDDIIGKKFNLFIEKIKFGNTEPSYCIKVVESKDIEDIIEDENDEEDLIDNMVNSQIEKKNEEIKIIKKTKTEYLKKLYLLFPEERKNLIDLYNQFQKISNEDSIFKSHLLKSKQEIIIHSTVHGKLKQDLIMDDENFSQTSSTYNEDLSKKNRIEEIRNNAFKSINNYYMFKYYKIILFVIISCFGIFLPIILILFDSLCKNLSNVTKINNKLYQTTNWITFLLSSLISFDTFYIMNNNPFQYNYSYNFYLNSYEEYIYTLKNYSQEWINNIYTNFSLVEKAIAIFTKKSRDLFWEKEEILNLPRTYNSCEPYPFALNQILGSANILLNDYSYIDFILNKKNLTEFQKKFNVFNTYSSINNGYHSFLPSNLEKINELPAILQKFNNNSLYNIRFANAIYAIIILFLICIYTLILYKTNKNIDDGFEKISKIKSNKIDETIKKLEQFNIILRKYIDINYEDNHYFDTKSFNILEYTTSIEKRTNINLQNPISDLNNNNQNNEENNINNTFPLDKKNISNRTILLENDSEKIKKLHLFKCSYLQPIILVLISIEFIMTTIIITKSIVKSTNEIINVQTFIYQLVLSASTSLLDLKYTLTYLNNEHEIVHLYKESNYSLQEIMNNIAKFDDILKLYNNMQINICDAAFNRKTQKEKYEFCINDPKVIIVNNTNSIFNLIQTKVDNLFELMNYYLSIDENFDIKQLYSYDDFKECEYYFYNYLISFIENIASSTLNNQQKKLNGNRKTAIILYIVVVFEVIIYALYILIFFLKRIAYLLSVARGIFRIIPINVIYSTQELSSWIENNFNG